MEKLILASASPRRSELMKLLQVPFEVKTADIEEQIDTEASPEHNVMQLAYQKASAVSNQYKENWVIGCDTVVINNGCILGKPVNESDAFKMIKALSNHTHSVCTGVCVIKEEKYHMFYETTQVKMKALSDEEILSYIATKEPMDKAGAYGIQGYASKFITGIEGDYFNVVGLPVSKLYDLLKDIGIKLST